jgi:hypothetical protein
MTTAASPSPAPARSDSRGGGGAPSLSKSRFTTGLQCHRLLWWSVNEPDAPELVAGPAKQALFDQGTRVGELARSYLPGGELMDLPYWDKEGRIEATRAAIAAGANIVYEARTLFHAVACFMYDATMTSVGAARREPR